MCSSVALARALALVPALAFALAPTLSQAPKQLLEVFSIFRLFGWDLYYKWPVFLNDIVWISHFAVTVKNVDSLYKKLKKNGIKFVSEPTLSNDKKVKLTFCRAPEGTLIEMVQVL